MPTSTLDRLIVRPARMEDVDVMVAFSAAMALETEGRRLDVDRLRRGTGRVFDSPTRGFYVVAELPQKSSAGVIGQLLVTYEWSDWRDATFWWIQSVYVHPDWRRRGVYRRMHEYVRQQARSRRDVCGLRLYVEAGNVGAQAAYRQAGLFPSSYRVLEEDFVLPRKIV
ncbi:MAG: GNAT family N-acetyltransferase [Candidatus Methylomirabilales bacterium]